MFDFLFKKQKQKYEMMYETKIEELENRYKEKLIEKDKLIDKLNSQIRGERVNDGYCCACSNSYVKNTFYEYTTYGCLLNVPCKDFQLEKRDE